MYIHLVPKHTCVHCHKEFSDKKKFTRHSRSCHLKAFACEKWGEEFPSRAKLYKHIKQHKDYDSTWSSSSNSIPKQSKAKSHGKKDAKTNSTPPEETKDTNELTDGDKIVPSGKPTSDESSHKPYRCQYCTKAFAAPGSLQQHLIAHVGSKPFRCPHCSEAFAHEEWLQLHLQDHARSMPHHCCMYCGKAVTSVAQLQAHTVMHTREMCQCQYCNRTFMEPRALQAHLWEHAHEKRHYCQFCDKSFTHKGALKAHLTTHKGEQHKCEYCNKLFVKYSSFVAHQKTHIGEKPHQCQYCGMAFSSVSGLWEHVRLHTVNKHYHCQYCGQVFTQSIDLQYHMTTHTRY